MTKPHRISHPAAARLAGVPLESLDAWAAVDRQGRYDTAEFKLWTEIHVAVNNSAPWRRSDFAT